MLNKFAGLDCSWLKGKISEKEEKKVDKKIDKKVVLCNENSKRQRGIMKEIM